MLAARAGSSRAQGIDDVKKKATDGKSVMRNHIAGRSGFESRG
jgi:hypothetical protein